jgi:hypothetical protein
MQILGLPSALTWDHPSSRPGGQRRQ